MEGDNLPAGPHCTAQTRTSCGFWVMTFGLSERKRILVPQHLDFHQPLTGEIRHRFLFIQKKRWFFFSQASLYRASQVTLVVKNLPASAGDLRDTGAIHESGGCPGGGHGSPLQYSCLENPMDRGAWRAIDHWVAKSRTRLKRFSVHAGLDPGI